MTSFQATLVNAGYGQLALRDQNGKTTQKWTLGAPKCVIGAHANCNVRCMLPGIADHHLLLVIGSRQIYMRALATGVLRDGVAVNELVLSGDQSQLAFTLAGHLFEYSREHSSTPIAKSFVEESSSPVKRERATDARDLSPRLRFTFVQALEKNRDRSEAARIVAAAEEAAETTNKRPAWVEEIVRDALRPVELRLETIAQPITQLERQLRRQRARLRKQHNARKLSQHAAHPPGQSHTQQLVEAQEAIQKIVADQSARLELVNERVSEVLHHLASLERMVSVENIQQQEVATRTAQSGEEIISLQREMLALMNALQMRIAQPPIAGNEDAQWRSAVQHQLDELHQSLGILDEIKSNLAAAVSQNRELSQDIQERWQTIEELAKRPVPRETSSVAPTAPLPQGARLPASTQAFAEPTIPSINDQPTSQQPDAIPVFHDEQLASRSATAGWISPDSAPRTPVMSQSPPLESPSALAGVRVADEAPSASAVPLPSWWAEDPVVPDGLSGGVDAAQWSGSPIANSSATDHANSYAEWQPTEFEQESGLRAHPWSYGPPTFSEAMNAYPELDVPKLLASSIAETPVGTEALPTPYAETSFAPNTNLASTNAQNKYAEQTFDEQHDIRDASQAVSQSASDIEDQLQQWLAGDYDVAGRTWPVAGEDADTRAIEQAAMDTHVPIAEDFRTGGLLDPANVLDQAASDAELDQDRDEYAVSAFSAERLAIEEAIPQHSPLYLGEPDGEAPESYGPASERIDPNSASLASSSSGQTAAAPSADVGDESVEDYMRRLLARMRGVSENEVKLPGLDQADEARPSPHAWRKQIDSPATIADGADYTEGTSETGFDGVDGAQHVSRTTAPEKGQDIDALRELANNSARSAIHVSARRKHLTAIMIKSGVSLVGLAAGLALVAINGFQVNVGLIATLASFTVALIWGYDALATLRPLLQAAHGAKSQKARATAQEAEVT